MKTFILVALMIFNFNQAFASGQPADKYFCSNSLASLPILQGGRVKPLYVHANEVIKNLTGKSKVGPYSAVEAYCLLSLQGMGLKSDLPLKAPIEHVDAIEFLNLKDKEHSILYEELLPMEESIRMEARRTDVNDSYSKAMTKLFNNLFAYKEIRAGFNWLLAERTDNTISWVPLATYLTEEKIIAQKDISPADPFTPVIFRSEHTYRENLGDDYMLELYYAKAKLPLVSMVLSILALGAMAAFKNFSISLGLSGLSLIAQIALLTLRVMISGRAPITNMYETVLFSGTGALFLGLALGHFKKEKLYVYMGLFYNVLTMMMINFANGMLTATISPLVPVLRDNFWLSTHVTTIILSYGALALSWILANTVLIQTRLGKISKEDEKRNVDVIYTSLKWGTVLLGAGIILGGVWADYSWGRFWGWDPKETWSLIVLCIYMAILHGRHTSWIRNDKFMLFTAAAFMSVMMAWFGVNYILASGLHSYGFSEGGAVFLGSFFLVQTIVLVITYKPQTKSPV